MAAALGGCATYGDYRDKPANVEVKIDRNYQAVYAQLLSSMRSCLTPGAQILFSASSSSLDSDLYPDLGYGEIVYGLSGIVPDTLAVARVTKDGAGTVLSIKTGNMIPSAATRSQSWLVYWAKGGTACDKGLGMAPTGA